MNSPKFSPTIIAAVALIASVCISRGSSSDTNSARSIFPVHVASRGVIKTKAQLDAVAEAVESEAVKLTPKAWTDLTVIDAVAHGSRVKKGDLLVKLDLDKLREQIEDLENDRPGASVSLELAKAEFDNLKQSTPYKLDAARRSQRIADEEYKYFEATGRASHEKNTKFAVKSSEQRLENANEEMHQLEKMYKADDITEETEEIVLKRQRFVVESAQFYLQSSRESMERDLKTLIPREEETFKNAKRDQDMALTLAEQTIPKTLAKKQYDLDKLKRDQRKADRKLTDLRYDLESLTPRSPMDGIVYYGACESGKWTTGAGLAKRLIPSGKLQANETVMTIVNPDKLRLRAVVAEGDLGNYSAGLKGEASPISFPQQKLSVKLDELGMVPLPGGGFDAMLSLVREKNTKLLPGMNCKVSFANVEKHVNIAIPKQAVFSEPTQKFVFVQKGDGSSEKRTVKTGESDEAMIEITDGIAAGEKVLLKRPELKPEV
jgi:HlyD family secretion protein